MDIERQAERYSGKRKWQHIGEEAQAAGVKVRDVDPNAWGHPKTNDTALCACGAWRGVLGLEPTPEMFIAHLVAVFREVRRVLRKDGTVFLNMGDSYAAASSGPIKPKDLVGVPWMLAFALRADGWYLRSDIIWSKPNPMPESTQDRPTKAHEYLFLLAKSKSYYYDNDAIREPYAESTLKEIAEGYTGQAVKDYTGTGAQNPSDTKRRIIEGARKKNEQTGDRTKVGFNDRWDAKSQNTPRNDGNRWNENDGRGFDPIGGGRNKRSVWTIPTQPTPEAHFATFPEDLVEPCIRAGCPDDGTVLAPFAGSGTVGVVCDKLRRQFIGIELNPAYIEIAERRIAAVAPLFAGVAEQAEED